MKRKIKITTIISLCWIFIFNSCKLVNNKKEGISKPNIILIYADDLGKGMLGVEGQKIIKTPNIDKLAKEGIRFTNAYSNMLCAPARASLITGLHDCHNSRFEIPSAGLYKKISSGEYTYKEVDSLVNTLLSPIPQEQVFLGNISKDAGYKTAQFGKLEWGFSATHGQMVRHGWHDYYGYLDHQRAHGFYPPFLFENGKLKVIPGNLLKNSGKSMEPETLEAFEERWDRNGKAVYSQDLFMHKIDKFIRSNRDNPFFIYFPTQLPHGPVAIPAVHPDFINNPYLTPIEKEYASMVKLLDDNIGQIINTLKELNLDDNTIIIFTADNGHEIYYAQKGRVSKPYTNKNTGIRFDDLKHKYYSELAGDVFNGNGGTAGLKRSNLQGGIQVPLIVRWPDKIKPGSISHRLIANYDWLPTIAKITGYSGPLECDGISFFNDLIGKESLKEHDYVVYSSFLGPTLITNEGWKIRSYLSNNNKIFEIYYLPEDFKEERDLSKKYPEKLNELKEILLKACDGDLENGHYTAKNEISLHHLN